MLVSNVEMNYLWWTTMACLTQITTPTEQPSTSATYYANLSTEVLYLLLAPKNLSLSGSRDTLLRCLGDHDRTATENPPNLTPSAASPNISQFSAESLRTLATNLAPLLRDVLSREHVVQQSSGANCPNALLGSRQSFPSRCFDLTTASSFAPHIFSTGNSKFAKET